MTELFDEGREHWQLIHAARRAGILVHCDLNMISRYDKLERIELHCQVCNQSWLPGGLFWEFLKDKLNGSVNEDR